MKIPKVIAPIEVIPNATVYFEVPTGEYEIDTVTRNKRPLYTETSVDVWVAEIGDTSKTDDSPGLNLGERRVRGYFLVESLPQALKSADRPKIVINTSFGSEEGRLFFSERITPLIGNISAQIGIPFEGMIQTVGGAR
jgi:hypothetical protein